MPKKPSKVAAKRAASKPEARRVPAQERSRARVERILDAAARELAEVGYEAATTEGIAARAGTSIGSLYQFFPNKQSLFDAIGKTYLEQTQTLFDELMARPLDGSWTQLVDDAIDAFWALGQKSLAFRAVWINLHQSGEFFARGELMNEAMAKRTAAVLSVFAPALAPAKVELIATVIVETMSSMLFLALRRNEPLSSQIVEETKVVVRRYLEPYAPR
ncbi:TetR/AcrR family transcriptional regulator [soil metagenome]